MKMKILAGLLCVFLVSGCIEGKRRYMTEGYRTSELTGDEVLDGTFTWKKESPTVEFSYDDTGFAHERLSKVPAVGVHPRVLLSPGDIADVRSRVENTELGKGLYKALRHRIDSTILKKGSNAAKAYQALIDGDIELYQETIKLKGDFGQGHYQHVMLTPMEFHAFDCMLYGKAKQGREVGKALATWARILRPKVEQWRSFTDNAGRYSTWHNCGSLYEFGMQRLGNTYDFAYNFMDQADRDVVRGVISEITNGAYAFGMNLPRHYRMWNWINVSSCFTSLALAIEGEEGYDARIYPKGAEMLKDYITYNYSKAGSSTEAAGYSSFGWVWGSELLVAAARRGDNFMTIDRYRAIKDWHYSVTSPDRTRYISHGDGGAAGPGLYEMQVMKYFYPNDPVVDYNWQNTLKNIKKNPWDKYRDHLIVALITACDGIKDSAGNGMVYDYGKKLNKPLTFFDPERGSLVTRTAWDKDATMFEFECRPDTFYAGHEHADRGNFNIYSHGQPWAVDGFRSVESRYHNVVLIDGVGQGYFPPPGKWLGLTENKFGTFGVCDSKYAYDYWWPKGIAGADPDNPKFQMERFAHFNDYISHIQSNYDWEYDMHPNVVNHFDGFQDGDPAMWDEDGWTIRIENNPVQKAFRTAGLVRGANPYMMIIDDIKKDGDVHLYEWTMMTAMDYVPIEIKVYDKAHTIGPRKDEPERNYYTDVILGSDKIKRSGNRYAPSKGEPLLLVRVLESTDPAETMDQFSSKPNVRVETFEKKDVRDKPGGRSFGMDKRLVVASRSVEPKFKVMIFPHRYGEKLPETKWNDDKSVLTVQWFGQQDVYTFVEGDDGRTRFKMVRNGKKAISVD